MFKGFFVIIILSFALTAFADPAGIHEITLKPMTGRNLAQIFAGQCSEKNWYRFAKWTQEGDFLSRTIPMPFQKIKLERGVVSARNARLWRSGGRFYAEINRNKYSGSDACDLFMQTTAQRPRHSTLSWMNLFMSPAEADDVVASDSSVAGYVIGGSLCALGILGIPISYGASAVVFCGGGAALSLMNHSDNKTVDEVDSLFNNKFNLTCNQSTMVVSNDNVRMTVDKTSKPYPINVAFFKNNQWQSLDSGPFDGGAGNAEDLATQWAPLCNSASDAKKLTDMAQTQRENVQQRMAALDHKSTSGSGATGGTEAAAILH